MSEYQECMTQAMRGFPKGITKEERGALFCANAKVCSGKAKDLTEAEKLCAEISAGVPRNPQGSAPKKLRRSKFKPEAMAQCLINRIHDNFDKVGDITEQGLLNLINECSSTTASKTTYKRFMNACVKEQGVAKDLPQNLRFIKACEVKWREQNSVQQG